MMHCGHSYDELVAGDGGKPTCGRCQREGAARIMQALTPPSTALQDLARWLWPDLRPADDRLPELERRVRAVAYEWSRQQGLHIPCRAIRRQEDPGYACELQAGHTGQHSALNGELVWGET